jgi:hypothetical protein
MKSFIIGRTVAPDGGYEFRWRDMGGMTPDGFRWAQMRAEMRDHHIEVFGTPPERVALVVLPAWDDEKLWKHPVWTEHAREATYGLCVIER